MQEFNKKRLFIASCFALITTAFAFAIRAGIMTEIQNELTLSAEQLGVINLMAFLGFPVATIVGGILYNVIGAKRMVWIAFGCHLIGILTTIFAGDFLTLLFSNFFIGFANGTVEAAFNPLVANMYKNNQTTMLNRFHVWFPGGIFLGSLITLALSGAGWQTQVAVMLVPMIIYGVLFWGQKFPEAEDAGQTSIANNLKGIFSPLYLFMIACMVLTSNTELSTQQWIELLMKGSGVPGLWVLVLVTGLMAVGRSFAGPVVHRLNPIGVLFSSAIIACLAIFLMSKAQSAPTAIAAAVLFAIGVCYFWPTMIGFTGEYIPKSGALGMSLMGGAGMFATAMLQPVVGGWFDSARISGAGALGHIVPSGLKGQDLAEFFKGLGADIVAQIDLTAGPIVLTKLLIFPMILIVAFGILFAMRKQLETRRHVVTDPDMTEVVGRLG